MEHRETHERTPIYRRDNLYYIKLWVKAWKDDKTDEPEGPFARPGR